MTDEKKKILEQIDALPEQYKSHIIGYAAGVIDAKAELTRHEPDDKR